jgi:hypothetical protein
VSGWSRHTMAKENYYLSGVLSPSEKPSISSTSVPISVSRMTWRILKLSIQGDKANG